MKIFEGNDDAMSVYLDSFENIVIAYTDYSSITHLQLTPLDALNLSNILKAVCDQTEYFQGLKQ